MEGLYVRCTKGCNGQVRDYLGSMNQCVSHVTTRLRYVQKLVVTTGSPNVTSMTQSLTIQSRLSVSVINVPTELNAPNGASIMNASESGEELHPLNEERFAQNLA